MVNKLASKLGAQLAKFLNTPVKRYESFSVTDPARLMKIMKPGDVLLCEGDRRISTAIKYLTQSTWSHAALYVGDLIDPDNNDPLTKKNLIEADVEKGIISVSLGDYKDLNTRVCRPLNLDDESRQKVVQYAKKRLGDKYDLKNVFDLGRYLFPMPPVPSWMRRQMLSIGSGDPTRAICSTLVAQSFQSINFPILPPMFSKEDCQGKKRLELANREIMHIRHHSLFTPRDFDVSPYFQVLKMREAEGGFDYRNVVFLPDSWNSEDELSDFVEKNNNQGKHKSKQEGIA